MRHIPVPLHNNQIVQHHDVEYVVMPDSEESQEKSLYDYLHIILRRKLLVIFPLFVILPFVIMNIMITKPEYKSKVTLQIDKVEPNIISIQEVLKTQNSPDFYLTQYEIIKSRSIVEEVVHALNLHKKKEEPDTPLVKTIKSIQSFPMRMLNMAIDKVANFFSEKPKRVRSSGSSGSENMNLEELQREYMRQLAVTRLQNALKVKAREGTQLVDVTLQGTNPWDVVQQLNVLAEVYVRRNLEQKLDASRKAIVWLKKEAESLKSKLHNSEIALQEFKEKNEFTSLESSNIRFNLVTKEIENLQTSYIDTHSKRISLKEDIDRLKNLSSGDIESMPELKLVNNNIISSHKNKLTDLQLEYSSLLKKFKPSHPRMILLQSNINDIIDSIKKELNKMLKGLIEEYNSLLKKESLIKADLDRKKANFLNLNKSITAYSELKRGLKIDKELYQAVSKRLAETTLTQALETNNIKIIEPALLPTHPVPSRTIPILLLSVVASLGLGVGLAFLVDNLDKRFKTTEAAESYVGIPSLGIIPQFKAKGSRLITLQDRWSGAAEAYRSIRTWIQLAPQSEKGPLKTVMLTSAIAGEGKSTTAANLAMSFGHLGWKTLLVDGDLRRPVIYRIFNIPRTPGLTDVLTHGEDWQSLLQKTDLDNVQVLPSGRTPRNPSELLSTGEMKALLADFSRSFDIVILDSPIALSIPDVAILAPNVDGVILVHYPTKGNKDALLEAKRLLDRAGARPLGMVFNRVSPKEQNHYYYSHYYGQSYYHAANTSGTSAPGSDDHNFVDLLPSGNRDTWVADPDSISGPQGKDSDAS